MSKVNYKHFHESTTTTNKHIFKKQMMLLHSLVVSLQGHLDYALVLHHATVNLLKETREHHDVCQDFEIFL